MKRDGIVCARVGKRKAGRRRGLPQRTAALAGMLLAAACSLSLPDGDDIDSAVDDAVDGAMDLGSDLGLGGGGSLDPTAILGALFPALTADEIAEISVSLSLEEILALRTELEAVRDVAAGFSLELFESSEERVAQRTTDLEPTDGFPESLEALGSVCAYDSEGQTASISLAGIFSGKTAIELEASQVTVLVGGEAQEGQLSCLHQGETVDIVLLVDITGSMASVIGSVRDSVVAFTQAVSESGLAGTVSVVTFQDTVGVDVSFQEPASDRNYERTPFFTPVDLNDGDAVGQLQDFVRTLEANRGADLPENLAAAIDFARSSVIGETAAGPIVVDGVKGPEGTRPFPQLTSERQVFIALTDIAFHSDETTSRSLLPEFRPRPAETIVRSLLKTGTVVHVIDPSWVDESVDPANATERVDADYWALQTGGLGEDVVLGYSLLDLELVSVAEETGLLDVVLDRVLASSCHFEFEADLSATAEVEVRLDVDGEVYTELLPVTAF